MDFNFSNSQIINIRSKLKFTLLMFMILFSTHLTTAYEQPLSAEEEKVIQEQARLRTYPGGLEESDLNVQGKLYTPLIDKPAEEAAVTSEF